jgi:hypothetical protein
MSGGRRRHPGRKATAAPPPLPAAYLRPETHPFLREAKAAILAGLNFPYRFVFRQRDLAIWLIAMGRVDDALPILEYANGNVRFRGKYGVSYAAATACSSAARAIHRGRPIPTSGGSSISPQAHRRGANAVREMAFVGFPRKGKLNPERLDAWINDSLARIRWRLDELA